MNCVCCYLDYDGVGHADVVYRRPGQGVVLAASDHQLFDWMSVLEEALQPWLDVRIVLSTSWVRELGYSRARSYLPPSLQQRVIGATFHRREHGPTSDLRTLWAQAGRGHQIAVDVIRRRPRSWFAIDDAVDEFNPEQLPWLVACRGDRGLSDPATKLALLAMLARVHNEVPMSGRLGTMPS